MDLFLAFSALEGHEAALEEVARLIGVASQVVTRIDHGSAFREDVAQEARLKVLVHAPPKLASYAGSGTLTDWLRVVVVRTALNLKRADLLRPTDEADLQSLMGADDLFPPTEDRALWEELRTVLLTAFQRLASHERVLLKLHFLDGLSTERLGIMYQVHRTTVARWLVEIRQSLFKEARQYFSERHRWETRDVRSLYRRMARNVPLAISQLLNAP